MWYHQPLCFFIIKILLGHTVELLQDPLHRARAAAAGHGDVEFVVVLRHLAIVLVCVGWYGQRVGGGVQEVGVCSKGFDVFVISLRSASGVNSEGRGQRKVVNVILSQLLFLIR